jgi:dihydrofolate synthase/folylpolyglutamate synthase
VEERVRIDGEDITRKEFERHLDRLAAFPDLTFFETVTAVAFLAFAEAGVEAAVLEAGMGGSWDATRVAASTIAGITNVGSDHAMWLGESAWERARDKGAPLRSAKAAVLGPGMAPELTPALQAPDAVEAASLVTVTPRSGGRVEAAWGGMSVQLDMPLAGEHQRANLHLALALARCAEQTGILASLEPGAVVRGVADVRWPGRLSEQWIAGRSILLDGAHNLEGAEALAGHLCRLPRRYNLLFSCLDDKPVEAMAGVLRAAVDEVAVVELEDERAMSIERLGAAFPGARVCPDLATALNEIEDPLVVAGSLRLVGGLLVLAE